MNELYEKYFGGVDIYTGESRIVRDIFKNRFPHERLPELIPLLAEKGLFNDEPFAPRKDIKQWNYEYLEIVASRFLAGVFSEVYLYHLSDVSKYYYAKKRNTIIIVAVISMIAIIIPITILLKNSDSAQNAHKTKETAMTAVKQDIQKPEQYEEVQE